MGQSQTTATHPQPATVGSVSPQQSTVGSVSPQQSTVGSVSLQKPTVGSVSKLSPQQSLCKTTSPSGKTDFFGSIPPGKSPLCLFYKKQNCHNGDRCKYLHMCLHYIRNICKFGSECKFSHNLSDSHNEKLLRVSSDDHATQVREKLQNLLTHMKQNEESDDSGKAKICMYYKMGKCRFNEKCKNLHSDTPNRKSEPTDSRTFSSSDLMEKSDICLFNMVDRCLFEDRCKNLHSDKPYMWIFEKRGKWSAFPGKSNDELEQTFCDPNKSSADAESSASDKCKKVVSVHFDSMTWNAGDCGNGKVKRLSTPSWGNFQDNVYSTKWLWFWQNDDKTFTEYGKSFEKDKIIKKSNVPSEAIEKLYIQNSPDITFNTSEFQHVIFFNEDTIGTGTDQYTFKQVNVSLKTERMVRRRPKLFDRKQRVKEKQEHAKLRSTFPSTWTFQDKSAEEENGYQLVDVVDKTSTEFKEIETLVKKTMAVTVTSVRRIQNEELWEGYSRKKTNLSKKHQNGIVNERRLFHGTKQNITEAICQQGFDCRLNGTAVGTKYGKGSYFARDSKYSSDYTDSKQLFIVKVLVGTSALGNTNMVRPPPRDPAKPYVDLHDSCVDNLTDPSIFVVFETCQAYPEYLVSYM